MTHTQHGTSTQHPTGARKHKENLSSTPKQQETARTVHRAHRGEEPSTEVHGKQSVAAGRARDGLRRIRAILSRYTTPLLPDDYTVMLNPRWSARELRGTISRIERQGSVVHLDITPGWAVPTTFHAGQFIGIGVEINGRFVWRSYSLTNVPRNTKRSGAGDFRITVRAVEAGKVSNHLHSGISAGTTVRLAAPAGDFHLSDPPAPALAFLAAGSGITPIMSMLRSLTQRGQLSSTDVDLVYSVREERDCIFVEELRQLASSYPHHFRVHFVLTGNGSQAGEAGEFSRDRGSTRRVTPDTIASYVPDIEHRVVYACGPAAMLDAFEAWAARKKVKLYTERFTLQRKHAAAGGNIHFASGKSIKVDGATTILEASEQAGSPLPYGCRMGICHTCTRTLAAGEAADIRTGTLYEQGARLRTCVSVACGDITIH